MSTAPRGPVEPALPESVRRRVLDLSAAALGDLPDDEVPTALVRVRKFAPGRRARSGATPLAAALERDTGFRGRVATWVREALPELTKALDGGLTPPVSDPTEVAAVVYLLRGEGWQQVLERALDDLRSVSVESTARQAEMEAERLTAELAVARGHAERAQAERAEAVAGLQEELVALRRELRRHRSDADRARAEAKAATAAATEEVDRARAQASAALLSARRAETELARARDALAAMRRADREGRSLAGSRARLLLDTVVEAASGLRRELGLAPADVLPADLVGESGIDVAAPDAAARAREDDDPTLLMDLLALPRAHLIVDGYNVTKSAYGDLPLIDQRARLLTGLSTLQARTRAEITCCFDGAALEGRVSAPNVRGVRVRFSDPGEIADELIRRLVRAEPVGRVVVVVSSDREVADGVRAAGARPVPSVALARLLERG